MTRTLVGLASTCAVVLAVVFPSTVTAQATGSVRGRVTSAVDGAPLANVSVSVRGIRITAVTDRNGEYSLERVPEGQQIFEFRWLGFLSREVEAGSMAGEVNTIHEIVDPQPVRLSEIVVRGPSRVPERVVDAPAAIAVAAHFQQTGSYEIQCSTRWST